MVGTFAALRPLVIDPVQRLAGAATRLTAGDLSARVEAGDRDDEVSELLRAFNRMAERVERLSHDLEREVADALDAARRAERAALIQKRLAAMGELAAGIAHEINNPLGGLQNAVQALKKEIPEERRVRYLDLLASGLERIERTVGQVLRMAPRETVAARVDLVEVVRDAASLVRHRADREGTRLVASADGGSFDPCEPPRSLSDRYVVLGARHELGQALLNLVVNALDAVEEREGGGTVEIGLADDGPHLRLWVRDDGPGVESEQLERLTDLFFSTKAPGRGTGLGLAIVHNVLDTHGGELVLSSTVGRGFTATCFLPRAPRT
ncbi:MAG: HAMP domain-containing sensor histidine kinase [Planctomycetota bacterium]